MPARTALHPASHLPMIEWAGVMRVLAALRPYQRRTMLTLSQVMPILDSSDWRETNLFNSYSNVSLWNQGQFGSCGGHAGGKTLTYAWLASGQALQLFSPTYIYAMCNGGKDNGVVMSDVAHSLVNSGTCLMSQFGENTIFQSQFTPDCIATAKRFRALEFVAITSFPEMMTAMTLEIPAFSGIMVGNNFSDLDNEGLAPLPVTPVGGHALAHIGAKKSKGGFWMVPTENSWGDWGMTINGRSGFCNLREEHWTYTGYYDAYAILGVCQDPQDPSIPPVAN